MKNNMTLKVNKSTIDAEVKFLKEALELDNKQISKIYNIPEKKLTTLTKAGKSNS